MVEEFKFREQEREKNDSIESIKRITKDYPEMTWLTGSIDSTPESSVKSQGEGTIGEHIFPNLSKKELTEFNRTAVGIMTLHWVMNDDYDGFTNCQKNQKLSLESFKELQKHTKSILQNQEDLQAMEVFMVINDLGKIKGISEKIIEKTKIEDVDHDKILLVGLEKHPEISPSFEKLSKEHQEFILNGLKTKFNIGQFIRGESVPASLDGLRGIDKKSLEFYLLHTFYDMAGAAGQFVQNGSVIMDEPMYKDFTLAASSLEKLEESKTLEETYDTFYLEKGKNLGLDISVPAERAVLRVCCMLKILEKEKAKEILEIFNRLPKNSRAILEEGFSTKGTNDLATLIYYAPAFLLNLQKKLNENGEKDVFEKSLHIGFTSFAKIFQESRIMNKDQRKNGICTVMASSLAKMAIENPEKISEVKIDLKKIGDDAEVELSEIPKINKEKFEKINDLSEILGSKIIPIGIGGGSDCIQAAMLADLLKNSKKDCPCIISIRTEKTGSQGKVEKMGEKRTIEKYKKEIGKGIYFIDSETTGTGRFLENLPTKDIPVYLIIEQKDSNLSEQIKSVIAEVGGADTVIAVDTGGDALYSENTGNESVATPDQDLRSLKAINDIDVMNKITCEIAVGVDTPKNGENLLLQSEAKYFEPSGSEITKILKKYNEWHMDGTSDVVFGKTALAWQEALKDNFGSQEIDLPTKVVLNNKNPWNPFVYIQPSTKGMFFMDIEKHLKSINQ